MSAGRSTTYSRILFAAAAAATVVTTVAASSAMAAPGSGSGFAYTASGVPIVGNGSDAINPPGQGVPMSAQMLAADVRKIQLASSFYKSFTAGASVNLTNGVTPLATNSKLLAATQQVQQTEAWCGPATVSESLAQIPSATQLTQAQAASALHTDPTNGTAWSGGTTTPTGYPVPDVMNAYIPGGDSYVAHAVNTVTSTEIANYENVLVYDVYNFNHPVIGNQYLVSTSLYQLAGEPDPPSGQYTRHWWNNRGYGTVSVLGDTTYYEDSTWTAYGSITATGVVTMVSGRGLVW